MLEVKGLSYSYANKLIFQDVSFVASPGKISVILGSSGVGKTTLFRLIAKFLSPTDGKILWKGNPITQKDVAYMQQKSPLLPWRTIEKNIYLASELGRPRNSSIPPEKFIEVVDYFRINELLERYPDEISEGQKQRVALACQCLSSKPILLLDEPFSSLDVITKEILYGYVLRLAAEDKKTVILVTHDFRDVAFLGDSVFLMKDYSLVPITFDDGFRSSKSIDLLIEKIRSSVLA
ncbi:Fe(3+) ions import ATP-binding protein FbpC [Chlamydia avium]|uniref:ABC transporter family protein n=1 Tax=Chlamydia avium TaxID=1457141 RepID=A0ABN0MRL3_9CHLA|nr:ABC transporter ATP-binding protein [Chlamydia avium]EPP36660.1 ABC transporter family protein [Chlamydia psittaci 10_743_SC13]EPP38068.1 ABC transporter family protein [Chlamydia avium]VVT42842.1 Fe(3+) ions import ATP-binding protein FbpC [Chlamydia avium]